uniref:spermatogenesis-associated protein 32 n=1 Tax=Halichoerus grypus TaxID=9711 RepID=UPI001659B632|nr:spermatogenesis-associated protein 32 [Halichoerus grypus]
MESKPKDPEQPESRTESFQPPTQQDVSQWSVRSNSSYLSSVEEDQASTNHRSICVQTSKHLFWADKHIQASEHSLERGINMQSGKNTGKTTSCQDQQSDPKDTMCSKKQLQNPSAQPAPPTTNSQQPPNPHPSSSSLSPGIGLADLVNFASSLAVASSSKMDLPNLEHMIKAPPQKVEAPSTDPDIQLAMDQPEKEKLIKDLLEKPLKAEESQKAWKQEDKNFFHPYLGLSKPGIKRASFEGEVKLLQQQARSPPPKGVVEGSVPRTGKGSPLLLKIHFKAAEGRRPREPRRRHRERSEPPALSSPCLQGLHGSLEDCPHGTQESSGAAMCRRGVLSSPLPRCPRGSQHPSRPSGLSRAPEGPGSSSALQLPAQCSQAPGLRAFQEIFKLFSSSPTGTVDMRSMKAALRNVGIQLSPQEMCEALQQADLDGDGTVSFKDFLGVLTDSHRLAQCLGQVRNSRFCDPQGLQTLFLEMLFKLMSQGFLPRKVVQEVMSYYTKKQRALRLNPGWRGRSRGHSATVRTQAGLTFFCQAARLSGLSGAELERSLHRLHKAGARSPYSQIPNLAGRTPPEDRMRPRAPRPDVRLPKSCHSSRHKLAPTRRSLSPEFVAQPLDYLRPAKMTPSPPTLVQKQPFSPSPACVQKPAMKK